MSLAIEEGKIKRVLLADGWHSVIENTFILDAYEYVDGSTTDNKSLPVTTHYGGQVGICATGFRFTSKRLRDVTESPDDCEPVVILGPLTSILAVEEDRIG